MAQPKIRHRYTEVADNTAQIGLMNNRRAYETIENRYNIARKRVEYDRTHKQTLTPIKGTNLYKKSGFAATPFDYAIVDKRDPRSHYHWMRNASGAIKPVYPEFDIITLGQGFGAGNVASKAFDKAATKVATKAAPYVEKGAYKGAYHILKSRPVRPISRRAVEVAMRTTESADPTSMLKYSVKELFKKENRQRLFDVGNYILTGKKSGFKGWYNSLADIGKHKKSPIQYYGGFTDKLYTDALRNDYIDAFLYGKTIDPKYGLKLVPNAEDFDGYTKALNHLSKKKLNKVQTYEVIPNDNVYGPAPSPSNITQKPSTYKRMDAEGRIHLKDDRDVNVAGHNVDISGDVIRQSDLWKFFPEEYKKKWGIDGLLQTYGLKLVNELGTPIITKTPWYYGKPSIYKNTYFFKHGGRIHINPANRGKFNATKRRTGKTTEELTHSKNPKTRKRAIFAQNAAKWRKRS